MKRKKEYKHHQSTVKISQKAEQAVAFNRWKYYGTPAIILLLSFIIYLSVLKNGFVWDDIKYIINNNLIKNLSWKGIIAIFSNFSNGSYAPLTDLINAVQYKISGLNPAAFHFGSLIFHLINVVLVFWFIRLLCNKWNVAAIAALFFGIHPMQVESVAWASGGSNLFCAAFFLGSLIAYLFYLRRNLKRYYFVSFILFILSLLSKAVAAVLPIVLLLIDYYKDRKITVKIFLEKSPFLILSLGVGILTLLLKNQAGSMTYLTTFSFPQRVIFASYGFVTYLFKLLLPLNLSAFYPYPITNAEAIPTINYTYLFILIGLAAFIFYSTRFSKKIFFGIGFFAITISLLLQLLPVGGAIMADRYSYVPAIGIFFIAGEGFSLLWGKKMILITVIVLSAFTVFFSVKTYFRCSIWNNDMTLWNDVINQYQTIPFAYYNRGIVYMNEKKYDQALYDYSKAIALNPNYPEPYYNRGIVFMNEKRYDQALDDFSKAIKFNPKFIQAYINRGIVFMKEGKYLQAINDCNKAIELNPNNAEAYYNRGSVFMNSKKYDQALDDFSKAIAQNSNYVEAFINRGVVLMNENKYDQALDDFNNAIALNPNFIEAFINRGSVFMNSKKYDQALDDFSKAIKLNPNNPEAYYNRGVIFFNEKNYEQAINNYSKAIELNASDAVAFYYRGWAEYYLGKKDAAFNDLKQSAKLGYKSAEDALSQIYK